MKALRAVAGSLSWVARQCGPDEAGTASTLQGSVSRAVVEDLSTNRAVNRLKQTEGVGLQVHAIPLVDLRTVSISDAALDLHRPDGSTQGGFKTWNEMLGEQSRSPVETALPAAKGPCAPSEPVPHSSGFVATSEHAVISGWSAGSFSPVQSIPRAVCVETRAQVGHPGVELVSRATYISSPSKPVFFSSGLAVTNEHAVEAVIPGFFC